MNRTSLVSFITYDVQKGTNYVVMQQWMLVLKPYIESQETPLQKSTTLQVLAAVTTYCNSNHFISSVNSTNHLGSPATKQLGGYSTTYSILRVTSVSGGRSRCHSMLLVWGLRVTEPWGTSGLFRLGSTRVTWGGTMVCYTQLFHLNELNGNSIL